MRNNRNTSEWKALRTQAIMFALGWQGGTVYQVQKELGLDNQQLHAFLYADGPSDEAIGHDDYWRGFNEPKNQNFCWFPATPLPTIDHDSVCPQYLIGMADWIIMNAAFWFDCTNCKSKRFVLRRLCCE